MATPVEELALACNAAIGFYDKLSKDADPTIAANLKLVAGQLKNIFDELDGDDNAKNLSNPTKRAETVSKINGVIDAAFKNIQDKIPPGTASGSGGTTLPGNQSKPGTESDNDKDSDDMVPMAEFFDTISTSLMKAQTALNQRSLDYVTNLDPRFQPTYYGIPSLKAEMRVGFSKTSERGVSLILFSKSEQKMQYGESTVSFEVVGAPPPPGPVSFGDYVVPLPRFLVVGQKREEVISRVAADKKIDQKVYSNTRDNILVLRFERGDGEPTKYLVIWPGQKVNQAFDYWHTIAVIHVEEMMGADGKSVWDYPADPETEGTQKRESIFEFPPKDNKGLLAVPTGNLEALGPKVLAQLAVNLGDVVMNVNLIMNQWLQAVRYQPGTLTATTNTTGNKT